MEFWRRNNLSYFKWTYHGTTQDGVRALWVSLRMRGANMKSTAVSLPKIFDKNQRGVRLAKFLNRHMRMENEKRIKDHPNDRK